MGCEHAGPQVVEPVLQKKICIKGLKQRKENLDNRPSLQFLFQYFLPLTVPATDSCTELVDLPPKLTIIQILPL
jgi:hypothetical protein